MVFSSSIFLFIFLPITLLLYFLMNPKFRNSFLLVASLVFYSWGEPRFVILMLASILWNYISGLILNMVQKKEKTGISKIVLIISIIVNLAALFYFKYFDFFVTTVNDILKMNIPIRNIILPIGISFYTFQAMSYVIDLYRNEVEVQKNPFKLALYVSLFPQLIAGPIVRYKDVCHEIDHRISSISLVVEGMQRFIIGLSKKVIISNQVALVADNIFSLPANQNSPATAWLGIICYTIQIYFDFSGYSDMAIGLGKIFGFHFLENFNYPYIADSITDFWRRWHISLSSWFRDYVYIPLGGNRKGNVYVNLFIVFLLTGIWHGASWNFIIWGLWNGLFLIIERIFRVHKIKIPVPKLIKHIYTMSIVILGWVLFRAPDLRYALQYTGVMFGMIAPEQVGFTVFWYLTRKILFILVIAIIASLPWNTILKKIFLKKMESHPIFYTNSVFVFKKIAVVILFFICIVMVMTSTYNPFIYFRF